jgi:uncharacterized protein (TIGR02271 family)
MERGQNEHTVTAFFDNRQHAAAAVERLKTMDIPSSNITMVEGGQGTTSAKASREEPGFWEALKDMFLPNEDRSTYAEGLRRGGYLVTVRAQPSLCDRAMDILESEGAVDMDERISTWRAEGWTYSAPATTQNTRSQQSGVLPVTEEQLKVGKRDTSRGRVRVRSYVVEEPVQETVNLREERVQVERRPVDRPAAGNEAAFQDRTIEAEERAEEAVLQKQTRVKEEVAVKKEAEQRPETVSDKVRRTEVKVEDERDRAKPTERRR